MKRKRTVKYRLEINYLSRDYEDRALCTSEPIYSLKEGWKKYRDALKEKCVDDKTKPCRVEFWKYGVIGSDGFYTDNITLAKNF